jgi:Zn-finger nucleic acid-binding protein
MIVVERNQIEMDYCLTCKGIWFDAEELSMLGQALKLDKPVSDKTDFTPVKVEEKAIKCPRCRKQMEKVCPRNDGRDAINRVSTLTLDRCAVGHGLWFDAGELGQLFQTENQMKTSRVVEFLGEVFTKC